MTIDWSAFTPWSAAIGGVVIGLAAALLVLVNGRVAGISGIVGGMLKPRGGDISWRVAFVAGLILAPVALRGLCRVSIRHDRCQLSRRDRRRTAGRHRNAFRGRMHQRPRRLRAVAPSPRSLAATLSFMAAGFLTVFVVRHVIGV